MTTLNKWETIKVLPMMVTDKQGISDIGIAFLEECKTTRDKQAYFIDSSGFRHELDCEFVVNELIPQHNKLKAQQ